MRILIVSFLYRPNISPRAIRWSAIAEHWASQGHDVEVLCGWPPELAREETVDGVRVHRVGCTLGGRLRQRLRGPDSSTRDGQNGSSRPSKLFLSAGQRLLRWGHDQTWKKLYWPDCSCLWYFSAVRKARALVGQREYNVLITSSHPFTGHLVGLRIKRMFDWLPWIVDVGDPFCFFSTTPTNNLLLYNRLNYIAEKKVFDTADRISVTNNVTGEIYAELFPASAPRIHVIHPLLRTDVESDSSNGLFSEDDRIRLSFIGKLHEKIRTPDQLLLTFQRLLETDVGERLELHIFGPLNQCEHYFTPYESLIGKRLFLHGPVSHETARQVMIETDFLVNIGNATTYQLPSKVVEYANSGKPILNLASISDDSSARFFETHPLALSFRFQPNRVLDGEQFAQLIGFLEKSPRSDPTEIEKWCQPFRIESISRDYESLIEAAVGHGNRYGLASNAASSSSRAATGCSAGWVS